MKTNTLCDRHLILSRNKWKYSARKCLYICHFVLQLPPLPRVSRKNELLGGPVVLGLLRTWREDHFNPPLLLKKFKHVTVRLKHVVIVNVVLPAFSWVFVPQFLTRCVVFQFLFFTLYWLFQNCVRAHLAQARYERRTTLLRDSRNMRICSGRRLWSKMK